MQGEKENISAFVSECYDKYHTAIYKFCLVRLGEMNEHADDCVQEVFLVFQNKLLEGIEILNPRAYLYKIADKVKVFDKMFFESREPFFSMLVSGLSCHKSHQAWLVVTCFVSFIVKFLF